ncbi:PREDICTED: legumin J-like [Prunus mume]|uniref:Legumin J-like n=1 Tax=Prunus mume TaxID=102107 RepID=A0ABM0P833_PRUMU|nr:PREDICTED: legumin J-like [Prunus mume]
MSMPLALASLCLLLLFNGCLASRQNIFGQNKEWGLNQLEAREPDNHIQSEAGVTESWNPRDPQFQWAGVAAVRRTIEPNGLHLPSYVNAPQLIYIVRGRGVLGAVFPGCAETFEDSQPQQFQQQQQFQPSRQEGGQGQQQFQGEDQQDRHQKIRHIREGDIIALPAGVAYWSYNNGEQPLVAVSFLDLSNDQNQLDQVPRRFYLAGNPQDEFNPQQQGRQQQQQQQGQQGNGNNIFSGFDTQLLAQALNVNPETARNLQSQNDNRNEIVKVQGQLDFVSPFSRSAGGRGDQERQQEEQQSQREKEEKQREQEQQGKRQQGGGGQDNGVEETFCSARLSQNIGDPSRADFYNPQAGRISVVNRNHLPILRYLGLSAEKGVLYNNAIYTPHWHLNANVLVYAVRGNARVQVVNENGDSILDDEVREGQMFLVPQNHAVIAQANNEGFEYISFKTDDNSFTNTLAGRTSVLRALPDEVLQNAFRISRQDARNLKYNRQESRLLSATSPPRGRLMSILGY